MGFISATVFAALLLGCTEAASPALRRAESEISQLSTGMQRVPRMANLLDVPQRHHEMRARMPRAPSPAFRAGQNEYFGDRPQGWKERNFDGWDNHGRTEFYKTRTSPNPHGDPIIDIDPEYEFEVIVRDEDLESVTSMAATIASHSSTKTTSARSTRSDSSNGSTVTMSVNQEAPMKLSFGQLLWTAREHLKFARYDGFKATLILLDAIFSEDQACVSNPDSIDPLRFVELFREHCRKRQLAEDEERTFNTFLKYRWFNKKFITNQGLEAHSLTRDERTEISELRIKNGELSTMERYCDPDYIVPSHERRTIEPIDLPRFFKGYLQWFETDEASVELKKKFEETLGDLEYLCDRYRNRNTAEPTARDRIIGRSMWGTKLYAFLGRWEYDEFLGRCRDAVGRVQRQSSKSGMRSEPPTLKQFKNALENLKVIPTKEIRDEYFYLWIE